MLYVVQSYVNNVARGLSPFQAESEEREDLTTTPAPEEPEESLGLVRVRLVPDSARQVAICHRDTPIPTVRATLVGDLRPCNPLRQGHSRR
jgi:hypothetical protein